MQLQDDVERELRMDFISRILKNVMWLSLVARDFLDICIWGIQLLIWNCKRIFIRELF